MYISASFDIGIWSNMASHLSTMVFSRFYIIKENLNIDIDIVRYIINKLNGPGCRVRVHILLCLRNSDIIIK